MIDTHCHLHGKEYTEDLDAVLARAAEAGVDRVVLVGVDPDDTRKAIAVAEQHPEEVFIVAGVHPHEAKIWSPEVRADLAGLLQHPQVVAVGEIGLDYHYDFSPGDKQREAFLGQLELSRETGKPVVIHCREAYDDLMQILEEFYGSPGNLTEPRGVLHCYFGSLDQARQAARLGYMIGLGGSCTFKKAEELHEVVRQTPLEQVVLETDAPYMTPIPYRGKRNESSYIPLVAQRVADLKSITVEEVARQTTANAERLYRITSAQ